ncbi:transposase [Shewanella hafniensis]|uniref:transposase n=1 Tax=Shewanella hafniensis TaxID=365590 RepID=UPI001BBE518F|nr:transposase [Shewanella hafniensis]MCL1136849.1 transposase [Shewanella hafniensis]GIU32669.1 transposase [Shewanella hafniensis]
MTSARRQLIDANVTPFYHVINRCVRRAFLCGEDRLSGRSYEHRRGWIVDKIKVLSAIFCIDICAYAVMSNHYHLVLKIDVDKAKSLTQKDIISRWCQITKGHAVATKYMNGDALIDGEVMLLDALLAEWHERLSSISWFMRCLNEEIARKANREDECKGAFWEGRFKSQALLDEQALLACMMYVDLNPIRAGIADSLQSSDFTSIQERVNALNPHINALQLAKTTADNLQQKPHKALAKFDGSTLLSQQTGIPFHFADYLELIDWTGRAMRLDKKGYIDNERPKLLNELGISPDAWLTSAKEFRRQYSGISGRWDSMCEFKKQHNSGKWCKGKASSQALHP